MQGIRDLWGRARGLQSRTILLLAGLFFIFVMGWAFIEIADEVMEGESHHIDALILKALRDESNPGLIRGPAWSLDAARDLTALGGHAVLIMFTLLAAIFTFLLRRYDAAILIIGAAMGGTVISSILKGIFGRERPDVVPHLVEVSTMSFPSGHAMLSACIYFSLAAVLMPLLTRRFLQLYVLGVALLLTLLVGLSRVYLGVHYPSDVLAGWCAGMAWAMLCWLVSFRLTRKDRLLR